MKGKAAPRRPAAVVAIAPLLTTHWRYVLEPLAALARDGTGDASAAAGEVLSQLVKTRRLSPHALEMIAPALEGCPAERETHTLVLSPIRSADA